MLKITNLSKSYGNKLAVNNISFSVESGEVVGFLGTNGAGKSTTMNMITGYISANSGSVSIDGYDILQEPEKAKKRIGYLPEIPPLYQDLTVWESLSFTYELKKIKLNKKEHLKEIAELVKVYEVKDRLIQNLSKGYRQRVGIANALVGNPPILILDEPTIGLDPKQIIGIRNLIGNLAQDRTVILSSHILQEIEAVCGRVIIINGGVIVADDTPENLVAAHSKDYNVEVTATGNPNEIEELLKSLDAVSSVRIAESNAEGTYKFYVNALNEETRSDISKILVNNEIKLLELRHNQPSLEEVFLKFTSQVSVSDNTTEAEDANENSAETEIETAAEYVTETEIEMIAEDVAETEAKYVIDDEGDDTNVGNL